MKWSRVLVFPLLLILVAAPWGHDALAWSRQGHMVTGAIAYARLQADDPEALAAVLSLLREHPQFEDLLQAPEDWGLDAKDRDLAVFMNAARWADDIRSGRFEDFSESRWHYVNYHYENGMLTSPGAPSDDGFLLWALDENRRRLQTGTRHDRAVALTWMFHLVGDAHQPLHTVAYHAPAHPDGDRGGNLFFVRVRADADTINLHWLWDDLVIGSDRFTDVRNKAIELRRQAALTPEAMAQQTANLDFDAWAKEGAHLAVEHVYRHGELQSGTREQGLLLPGNYIVVVQPLAEQRAVLAGYRLARLLANAF